jgi:hypothetical protein
MRKLHRLVYGTILLAMGLATTLAVGQAAGGGGGAATAAATAPMDAYSQDLLTRLNSTNPTVREAAQKQILSIAGLMQQPELLGKLQEATTEQELKDFFASRVSQLRAKDEERRMSNLPKISLSLKGATLAQVVTELNDALKAPQKFEFLNQGGPTDTTTFTLELKDKPFWEAFVALQEQQPIEVQNYGDGRARLMLQGYRSARRYVIEGPLIAYAQAVNYQRSISYQQPPNATQPPSLSFQMLMMVDPRIRAQRIKPFTNVKAVDDEGRTYESLNSGGGYYGGGNVTMMFSQSLSVKPPERLGKTLTVSFDTGVSTTVGDTQVTIDDIYKSIDKPVTMGNRTVRVASASGSPNATVVLNMQANGDMSGGDSNIRVPFTVKDSTGRVLTSSSISMGGMSFGLSTNGTTGPYKVEFQVPGRVVELPVHMELKDLPLP